MYLMFKYDPETGRFLVVSEPCDPYRDARHDDAKLRDSMLKNFIAEAKLSHGVKGDGFVADCHAVAHAVSDTQLDFHLRLVKAHWLLDTATRLKREASALAVLRTYFGRETLEPDALVVKTAEGSLPMVRMLVTTPDELLEDLARLYGKIAALALKSAAPNSLTPLALELLPSVTHRRALIDGMQAVFNAHASGPELMLVSECAWAARSIGDCGKLTAKAIQLAGSTRGRAFLKMLGAAFQTGGQGWSILALDAIASAILEWSAAQAATSDATIVAWYVEQCEAIEQRRYQVVIEATLDAVRRGVDLGAFTGPCKTVMAKYQLGSPGLDEKTMLALLRQTVPVLGEKRLSPFGGRFTQERLVESPWIRHAWRWAMDLLTQWCDGPLACEGSEPLDVDRICKDLNQLAGAKKPTWSVDDVKAVIRVGLDAAWSRYGQSLRYHRRTTEHLVSEPQADAYASLLISFIAGSAPKLHREIVAARTRFAQAARAIAEMRQLTKPSTAFDVAAFKATVVAGLRAMPPQYTAALDSSNRAVTAPVLDLPAWAAICRSLEDHWLGQVPALAFHPALPAATNMPLGDDAALALSVTAPMHEPGAEHFVMVEAVLWRRRRGSDQPPAIAGHPDAPMNLTHWYPTLVPCARLRLPFVPPHPVAAPY